MLHLAYFSTTFPSKPGNLMVHATMLTALLPSISTAMCGLMMYFAPATMVPLVYVVNSKLPSISTDYLLFPTASYLALTIHS
jgi:hypothetical protein